MSTAPLYRQQSVVLDGSGNGTIQIDIPAVENWSINAITVNATPNTQEAQCRIYRGQHGSQFLVDSTISGSSGDTSDTIHDMLGGESLYVEWRTGYAKIASIYYPSSDKTSVDLLRNANRGRLVTDGPWRVGTYVQVPKYVTPKYYMSTKKTDTEAEIAAKNGISRPSLRALNPGMKFPVKAGTRVRVR